MKKIPTIFERDWTGDRSRVVNKINKKAQWVFDGEGWPTRKLDGTSCLIKDGRLFKRRELRKGEEKPSADFVIADYDEETGKTVGWLPVGDGKEDRWHREAFGGLLGAGLDFDGTYELIGPKVQGNPEKCFAHELVAHIRTELHLPAIARTFEDLKEFLTNNDMEGIVFHHPDGRMAKIKARDFGLKRKC